MTYENMTARTEDDTERRKEIAHEIYHQIKTSLHRHLEHEGHESNHSLIRELRHEKQLALRALTSLGVEAVSLQG